uniref:NADH-plastoquinone oxidoreductase subunit 3 n=1 Tax=Corydalis trisecta TaxID=2682942 RepID=A0A6B9QG69_9MAGN|nr:NADH-plastoquinone oxidoreductase subunit 3 [Corydalis trisecta]
MVHSWTALLPKEKRERLVLALKIKKDLSEIAGWVGPTKKGMGVPGQK